VVLGVPCPADEDDRHALFNGVGAGTVALIALAEFLDTEGFSAFKHGEAPTAHRGRFVVRRDHRFGVVLGLVHRVRQAAGNPARPIGIGKAQQPLSLLLAVGAVVAAGARTVDAHHGCAVRPRCLFATRTPCATGCVGSRNTTADPFRGLGMSPNYVWRSRYIAV
jgi:hypothetical protein